MFTYVLACGKGKQIAKRTDGKMILGNEGMMKLT